MQTVNINIVFTCNEEMKPHVLIPVSTTSVTGYTAGMVVELPRRTVEKGIKDVRRHKRTRLALNYCKRAMLPFLSYGCR